MELHKTKKVNSIWQKLTVCVVAVVVTVATCELLARFFAMTAKPTMAENQLFEQKYFLLENTERSAIPTIFLVGDSTMNRAGYPDLLEVLLQKKHIRARVLNLAFDGGRTDAAIALMKEASRRGIRPALVLWSFCLADGYAHNQTRVKNLNKIQIDEINKSYIGRCLLCKSPAPLEKCVCWLEKVSYLMRYRSQIKTSIKSFCSLAVKPTNFEASIYKPVVDHTDEVSKKGWNPSYDLGNVAQWQTADSIKDYESWIKPSIYDANHSRFSIAAFQGAIKYCDEQKIKLCFTVIPAYRPILGSYILTGDKGEDWILDNLKNTGSKNNSFEVIAFEKIGNDHRFFTNPGHVNILGAIETTKQLANTISQGALGDRLSRF